MTADARPDVLCRMNENSGSQTGETAVFLCEKGENQGRTSDVLTIIVKISTMKPGCHKTSDVFKSESKEVCKNGRYVHYGSCSFKPGRLVAAAVIGLVLLLVLIIKFKVQAMVAILIGAIAIGLLAGMPYEQIVTAVNDGIGNTLKGIALLVGLGSMFGAILEVSGGAQTLAVTMVKRFGDQKAAWALGITGLVIAMPVFFDAGLIILIPLAFSLAKRTKRSSLFYAIPLLAGLAVGHAFIPPTPGPILVANMLNVDLGWVIGVGIFCGIFAMIVAGPVWGSICGKKYMVPVPEHVANQADMDESKLPGFWTIVGIILIPWY